MTPSLTRNDFLPELLSIQQDGRHAISAPSNWIHKPLLDVETEVDEIVGELERSILVGSERNATARWHFFIGSSGNGKSAAMGKLCRQLNFVEGCRITDEDGVAIKDLESTAIPYAMIVKEDGNDFITAEIIQDASVVRNPFRHNVDPAAELLETLKTSWDKGISLIVCTNRGVLEKAHRDNHTNRDINSKPWFKILAGVVSAKAALNRVVGDVRTFNGNRTVFDQVRVSYSHLDNRSLLLERDTFDRLVQSATAPARWEACDSCPAREMCPFKLNREWLADDEARARVLELLTRAEVLSGQIIVFREALAIISLILAGCPKDYENQHPCEWVQESHANDDIFSLASRRIYMSLFASFSPHGLEDEVALRQRQLSALSLMFKYFDEVGDTCKAAVEHVGAGRSPSTDVGVTRLLGANGIIASLDPCREALLADFYARWDADFSAAHEAGGPLFTEIERQCVSIWKEIEDCLESVAVHSVPEAHWSVQRWSSNFLLHFSALLEGLSAWSDELDEFAQLLSLVAISPEIRTIEDKRAIRKLNRRIENLLNAVAGNQDDSTVQLSNTVALSGQWVRDNLKPRTVASEESGSVSLAVEFVGGERVVFAAPMYLWLTRRAEGKLDDRCFPQELMSGAMDARIRAASRGKYAFQNNDVTLVINENQRGAFELTRFDGAVDVIND